MNKYILLLALIVAVQLSQGFEIPGNEDEKKPTITCDTKSDSYVDIKKFPQYEGKDICSYSGFLSDQFDGQVFYWHFPSTSQLSIEQIPAVIFINGILGQSSLNPLFAENGPLKLGQKDGKDIIEQRKNNWSNSMSIIYVDLQQNVGFNENKKDPQSIQQLAETLTHILSYFQGELKKQTVSLYSREFGSKIALLSDLSGTQSLILDNPLIDTAEQVQYAYQGALGLGVLSPTYEDIATTFQTQCQNAVSTKDQNTGKICQKLSDFYRDQSQLDPRDVEQNENNLITETQANLDKYINANLNTLAPVLHLGEGYKKTFETYSKTAFDQLQQYYHVDVSEQFKAALTKLDNVSMIFGTFNLINGPQGGYATLDKILAKNPFNGQKYSYTTGIQSEYSGQKLGFYHTLQDPKIANNFNYFIMNTGGYLNSWTDQSKELVYNIAYGSKNFCFNYNEHNCSMNMGYQTMNNNCYAEFHQGLWDEKSQKCVCKSGYGLSDCSALVNDFHYYGVQLVLKYRQQYNFKKEIGDTNVLLQIKDQNTEYGDLQVIVSYDELIIDPTQTNNQSSYVIQAQKNLNGYYEFILDRKGTAYVSIQMKDFVGLKQVRVYVKNQSPEVSFFEQGEAGFSLSIAFFSIGIILILASSILFCKIKQKKI